MRVKRTMRAKLLLVTTTSHGNCPIHPLLIGPPSEVPRSGRIPLNGRIAVSSGGRWLFCSLRYAGGGICTVMRHMLHKVNHDPTKYCVVCVVIPPGDASRTLLILPKSPPVCLESVGPGLAFETWGFGGARFSPRVGVLGKWLKGTWYAW
jgi:hypothetical protein